MDTVEKLLKKIKRKKLTAAYFADFVHQAASARAMEINNGGLSAQVSFLLEGGWSEKDIIETFE